MFSLHCRNLDWVILVKFRWQLRIWQSMTDSTHFTHHTNMCDFEQTDNLSATKSFQKKGFSLHTDTERKQETLFFYKKKNCVGAQRFENASAALFNRRRAFQMSEAGSESKPDGRSDLRSRLRRRKEDAKPDSENAGATPSSAGAAVPSSEPTERHDSEQQSQATDEKPDDSAQGKKIVGFEKSKRGGGSEPEKKSSASKGSEGGDIESGIGAKATSEKKIINGPLVILEPARTDPLASLKIRHKKLERVQVAHLPEIHFVGQLLSGRGIINDSTEGCCCRSKNIAESSFVARSKIL
jgi:hypothetical protein